MPIQQSETPEVLRKTQLANVTETPTSVQVSPLLADTGQVEFYVDVFGSSSAGAVPASGGGTTNFLRADGTWAAPPGGGGGVSDGDKGDITVSSSGAVWTIDASAVTTTKLGGDITTAGKALLDDADAAAQRTTLGLGTMATQNSDAYATASHEHAAADIISGTVATARLGSGTADATTFLRGDQTWATSPGGDGWTNVILGSDFTNSTTSNNTTDLSFTPAADSTYYVEVYLLLRTATTTVGARPGFSFPTGLTDSGAWMQAPNSATASAQRWWGTTGTANAASTGLADTTNSWLAIGGALLIVGSSPSGSLTVTLASETNGTTVTLKAGSFLRYRTIS